MDYEKYISDLGKINFKPLKLKDLENKKFLKENIKYGYYNKTTNINAIIEKFLNINTESNILTEFIKKINEDLKNIDRNKEINEKEELQKKLNKLISSINNNDFFSFTNILNSIPKEHFNFEPYSNLDEIKDIYLIMFKKMILDKVKNDGLNIYKLNHYFNRYFTNICLDISKIKINVENIIK